MIEESAKDLALAAVGKNMALGGGSSAVIFGMGISEIAAMGGLVVALLGLCIQFYYKRRADKRDEELHTARMADLRHE